MSGRRKPESRCFVCSMRAELCICPELEVCRRELRVQTRVVILMHHREQNLTTNTARLATLALPDCQIRVRGLPGEALDTSGVLDADRECLFLFPSDDAEVLDEGYRARLTKPVTLIVPDGSWRQASKVGRRESFLHGVRRVKVAPGAPSEYRLRREPKAEGLATFEAIARILGVLEGSEAQVRLETIFRTMVERTLASRAGRLDLTR